jgi:hypothetical protein
MSVEAINEDRRISNITAAITLAVAATAITIVVVMALLELKPWRVQEARQYVNPGGYQFLLNIETPEGWWRSRYTHDTEEARRAWEDRWQIGDHMYRTKDLMGRRI